jgi:hypothetical protein
MGGGDDEIEQSFKVSKFQGLRAPDDSERTTLKYVLITSLSIAWCLTVGILDYVRAPRITQFYRNHYSSSRFLSSAVMFPLRAWVKSNYYETSIMVCGAFLILMALFLAFVMIRGLFG